MNQMEKPNLLQKLVHNAHRLVSDGYYLECSTPDLPKIRELKMSFVIMGEVKPASPITQEMFPKTILDEKIESIGSESDALSILVEPNFFGGDLSTLKRATEFGKPVLMKDIIVDSRQLHAAFASTILLIYKVLSHDDLTCLICEAQKRNLEIILEVDNEDDFLEVLDMEVDLVAINNRDLTTFEIDKKKVVTLLDNYRPSKPILAFSGISTIDQVISVKEAGAKGVLIGSHLSKIKYPALFLKRARQAVGE